MFGRRAAFWNALYLLVAAALILAVVLLIKRTRSRPDVISIAAAVTGDNSSAYSLAVLPVKTDNTTKNSDYLKSGLPEDLIRMLSVTPGFTYFVEGDDLSMVHPCHDGCRSLN